MRKRWAGALLLLAACSADRTTEPPVTSTGADTVMIPLNDLGSATYRGFQGGLYPSGSNQLPVSHATVGLAQSRLIHPLNAAGQPDPNGKYILLSIGMSNTTQEFCSQAGYRCDPWTFVGQAQADFAVNHTSLVFVNGARGGQVAEDWDNPNDANYNRIRDEALLPAGLSEAQVQIAWVKVARSGPTSALPNANADAYMLQSLTGAIARSLKQRYPNLRQVFLSTRIYAGWASTTLNPEPYAYESGFAAKWAIESQIKQLAGSPTDTRSGDLSLQVAPWLAWGPYLWSRDAAHPRSDGFYWVPQDFQSDGTHPAQSGEQKVGKLLLDFFKSAPQTRCWFLAGQSC